MGDSPPAGYSGGSTLAAPPTEIPMERVQGGGGWFSGDGGNSILPQPASPLHMEKFQGGGVDQAEAKKEISDEEIAAVLTQIIIAAASDGAVKTASDGAGALTLAGALTSTGALTLAGALPAGALTPTGALTLAGAQQPGNNPLTQSTTIKQPELGPAHTGPKYKTKVLKSGDRVRRDLPDPIIKQFLDPQNPGFMLEEDRLFRSLLFIETEVRVYLQSNLADYVQFWRDYIEHDGTNDVMRAIHPKGRSLNRFLENIRKSRLAYLTQSLSKLLRRDERKEYYQSEDKFDFVDAVSKLGDYSSEKKTDTFPPYKKRAEVVAEYSEEKHKALIKALQDAEAALKAATLPTSNAAVNIDKFSALLAQSKEYTSKLTAYTDKLLALEGLKGQLDSAIAKLTATLTANQALVQALHEGSATDVDYIMGIKDDNEKYTKILDKYKVFLEELAKLIISSKALEAEKKEASNKLDEEIKNMRSRIAIKAEAKAKAPPSGPKAPASEEGNNNSPQLNSYDSILSYVKEALLISFSTGRTLTPTVKGNIRTELVEILRTLFEGNEWKDVYRNYYTSTEVPENPPKFFQYLELNKKIKPITLTNAKGIVTSDKFKNYGLKNLINVILHINEYNSSEKEDIMEFLEHFLDDDTEEISEFEADIFPERHNIRGGGRSKRVTRRLPKIKSSSHFPNSL